MKIKKIGINEKIVNACELPKDVIWGASIISITGNREIYIENFKNIMKFQPDSLIIQCKNYQIGIVGENLTINSYTKEDINIQGKILEIKFM